MGAIPRKYVNLHASCLVPRASNLRSCAGFGLIEVIVAMLILMCALMGVMGLFHWAEVGFWEAMRADRALSAAESRLEAKRAMPWNTLLRDDPEGKGDANVWMRDDGMPPDEQADDGIYTAGTERDGIKVVWTVRPDWTDHGPALMARVGSVVITAQASYPAGPGQRREIKLATIRANPNYVGPQ